MATMSMLLLREAQSWQRVLGITLAIIGLLLLRH
jgi:uncharacterized membrane protein